MLTLSSKKFAVLALAVLGFAGVTRADLNPIPLTPESFNYDVVVENTAPAPVIAGGRDGLHPSECAGPSIPDGDKLCREQCGVAGFDFNDRHAHAGDASEFQPAVVSGKRRTQRRSVQLYRSSSGWNDRNWIGEHTGLVWRRAAGLDGKRPGRCRDIWVQQRQ